MNHYLKFGTMIATSTIIMYLIIYYNVLQLDHIFFSQTRVFMALIMGSMMAIVMLFLSGGCIRNEDGTSLYLQSAQ